MKVRSGAVGLEEAELLQLEEALSRFSNISIDRRFLYHFDQDEMQIFLRAIDPDVLFVSTALPRGMEETVVHAMQISPTVQIVLVDSAARSDTLRQAMQLGVRECLSTPICADDARGVIERSLTRRQSVKDKDTGTDSLYSFFPARGGVGASILATQTALSLPVDTDNRALLIDADLDGGMIEFLLKIPVTPWVEHPNNHSLIEAMERVEQLDELLWSELVIDHGHLDILRAGDCSGDFRPDLFRLQPLLAFARKRYVVILVDLPAAINRLSTELILQSKAVFLVTTPDAASLHMARRRLRALRDLHLDDRVRLLVNRVGQNDRVSIEEVASAVGLPVDATFADDYTEVQNAVLTGGRLPAQSSLGEQVTDFTASWSANPVSVPSPTADLAPTKRRFLQRVFASAR